MNVPSSTRNSLLVAAVMMLPAIALAGLPHSAAETLLLKQQHFGAGISTPRTPVRLRYGFTSNDPLVAGQWHLFNGSGVDVNIQDAWAAGWTGAGVTLGVIDDGLQWDHPDLFENYSAADSYDFGSLTPDSDPYPVYDNTSRRNGDNHGTSVAGVAGARGGNGIGLTGAAPSVTLAGLRADFHNFYNADQFAEATRYRSTGAATTIDIKNHSYGMSTPYLHDDLEIAALAESTASGTIHIVSAGNGRDGVGVGDSNLKALQASHHGITVAALGHDGFFAPYSSWGANVFVTAPSSGSGLGVTTTDRTGSGPAGGYNDEAGSRDGDPLEDLDYTSQFGGTSASAPLVSGVLALAKEANPLMDSRLAKHLLVLTSDSTIDSDDSTLTSDGGWITNGAGNRFNQNYGFGLVDASALVEASLDYVGVTAASYETVNATVNRSLPDAVVNDAVPGQLTSTFQLAESGRLEEMLIELEVQHSYIGDLQANLTSPSGTTSRLMLRDVSNNSDDLSWSFTSNAFWGEDPTGDWSLTLEDWYTKDRGLWKGFTATAVTGALVMVPEPSATLLVVAIAGCLGVRRSREWL